MTYKELFLRRIGLAGCCLAEEELFRTTCPFMEMLGARDFHCHQCIIKKGRYCHEEAWNSHANPIYYMKEKVNIEYLVHRGILNKS